MHPSQSRPRSVHPPTCPTRRPGTFPLSNIRSQLLVAPVMASNLPSVAVLIRRVPSSVTFGSSLSSAPTSPKEEPTPPPPPKSPPPASEPEEEAKPAEEGGSALRQLIHVPITTLDSLDVEEETKSEPGKENYFTSTPHRTTRENGKREEWQVASLRISFG